ncbi:condensation domain-containing protein [Streptomyces sp. TS71-3]|uniref:condensation domain-containing protein n=1 Tax=Streptomyces sp. TS71-3 TaxID=2733862 RepID=UPI001B064F9D|nr:condensation domain-containing protein [Streptomyces sp. TS71-3]GHJ39460.1 hypothetical protein Sm713_50690 [Streptomyces sp. TS71-3]
MRAALKDVVDRHESLRTVFPSDREDNPGQRVLDAGQWDLEVAVTECALEAPGDCLVSVARAPFDLEHETVLLLVLHHISADGWSLTPLTRDLGTAYAARAGGRDPGLILLPVQCEPQVYQLGAGCAGRGAGALADAA